MLSALDEQKPSSFDLRKSAGTPVCSSWYRHASAWWREVALLMSVGGGGINGAAGTWVGAVVKVSPSPSVPLSLPTAVLSPSSPPSASPGVSSVGSRLFTSNPPTFPTPTSAGLATAPPVVPENAAVPCVWLSPWQMGWDWVVVH